MRQLSEPAPGALYARRFARLWFGLAVAVLVLAALLTWYVVYQSPFAEIANEQVALFGHYRPGTATNVVVQWTARPNSYQNIWYVKYPPGTQLVVLPGTGPCSMGSSYSYESEMPFESSRVRAVQRAYLERSYVWVNVAGADGDEVTCIGEPHPTRVSFTRYEFRVAYHAKARPALQPIPVIHLLPNIERAESLEMRGAPSNGYSAELRFGDTVDIEYSNAVDQAEREILFVVIGALIALGAAMLLESLRPAVESAAERWAERHAVKNEQVNR